MLKAESDTGASAFVGDAVKKNGSIYLMVDIDVNLLLLALMEQERSRFIPLDQLLRVEGYSQFVELMRCDGLSLESISDVDSSDPSLTLVRLNDEKALSYLLKRVDRTSKYLLNDQQVNAIEVGGTNTFNGPSSSPLLAQAKLERRERAAAKEAQRIAMQLLFEFLNDRWRQVLASSRGWTVERILSAEPYQSETPEDDDQTMSSKTLTWEEQNGYCVPGATTINDMRFGLRPDKQATDSKRIKQAQPAQQTLAQKKLAQVNTKGMQSLSSFFGKAS